MKNEILVKFILKNTQPKLFKLVIIRKSIIVVKKIIRMIVVMKIMYDSGIDNLT